MNVLLYVWSLPYMRWHIIFTVTPSILLWGFYWQYYVRFKKTILYVMVFSFIWGLLFDLVASDLFHLWHFNAIQNLGISFLGLPLEEYLFLLLVPQELTLIFLLMKRMYK